MIENHSENTTDEDSGSFKSTGSSSALFGKQEERHGSFTTTMPEMRKFMFVKMSASSESLENHTQAETQVM